MFTGLSGSVPNGKEMVRAAGGPTPGQEGASRIRILPELLRGIPAGPGVPDRRLRQFHSGVNSDLKTHGGPSCRRRCICSASTSFSSRCFSISDCFSRVWMVRRISARIRLKDRATQLISSLLRTSRGGEAYWPIPIRSAACPSSASGLSTLYDSTNSMMTISTSTYIDIRITPISRKLLARMDIFRHFDNIDLTPVLTCVKRFRSEGVARKGPKQLKLYEIISAPAQF